MRRLLREPVPAEAQARPYLRAAIAALCLMPGLLVAATAAPLPYLGVPPSWESRAVYYQSFDRADGAAEVNATGMQTAMNLSPASGGILGACGRPGAGKGLVLTGSGLSPHLPLAISFWWALPENADRNYSTPLLHLPSGSGGFVSTFTRTGPWCGLTQAAAVLQVHNLPGIPNVNAIYDPKVWEHLDGRAGVWHHTALVFTGGTLVELYTDGRKVHEERLLGRAFSAGDNFSSLQLGCPHYGPAVALDEVMVLNRPLQAQEIAQYVTALQTMREAGY